MSWKPKAYIIFVVGRMKRKKRKTKNKTTLIISGIGQEGPYTSKGLEA